MAMKLEAFCVLLPEFFDAMVLKLRVNFGKFQFILFINLFFNDNLF